MNNINQLDLNLLKALNALLEERSVTKAAKRLALTQPAVSSMLNRLRHRFEDPLFIRAAHGIIPTERALALAEPVKRILCEIDALVQKPDFVPAELNMSLRIAATDNGFNHILPAFSHRLRQIAPNIRLATFSIQGRPIEAMLEKGELDLIICSDLALPPNVRYRKLYNEHYVCLMRTHHPIADKPLDLTSFCAQQHILVSYSGGRFDGATDKALAAMGHRRNVAISLNNFLLLPELLRQSDYIAVAPHHLLQHQQGIIAKQPPLPIQGYSKCLAWHERTHHSPVYRWLRQQIIDQFTENQG
ncbi:LysR family transcriptional regulator [Mesocricetibacter intestinalis]|uniref:LysR family transcriptional regulator n=1 Tax=Mesocricetibacter intestinalis TaxID=1521930 RepID=A0A4R6V8S1_9PAST|nr:LysR family transcriptional regulator [Mesocricetibacter intestinalis]TDQ57978.1 LysR family transcriptional regulator [Mesocricetibacter intestinalis]